MSWFAVRYNKVHIPGEHKAISPAVTPPAKRGLGQSLARLEAESNASTEEGLKRVRAANKKLASIREESFGPSRKG